MKIAFVTDIHSGRESLTKKGGEALALMREFSRFIDDARPDVIVDLGDRITDVDRETDLTTLGALAEVFAQLQAPRYHILGNHDLAYLTLEDNERLLGQPLGHRSVDVGGWHLVLWQANVRMAPHTPVRALASDLEWLRADLEATSLPAVVCTHVPLNAGSMRGNYYFQANPEFAGYENVDAIVEVLLASGNVAACVAGHVHWNSLARIDAVPFVTVQSLTESFTTAGEASGAWALLELGDDLHWRTHGQDPIEVRVPLGGGNQRWIAPLPSFAERRAQRRSRASDGHEAGAAGGLAGVQGLLLDLDGTVYLDDEPILGAAAFLAKATAAGLLVGAITNNARVHPAACSAKLARMGIDIPPERIVTAGDATAHYLTMLTGSVGAPRVMVVGSEVLRQTLAEAGVVEVDEPDFVVLGIDLDLRIEALARAAREVGRGAQLIVTNPDPYLPASGGGSPEAGAVRAFMETATGQRAVCPGKPHPALFELGLARLGLTRDTALVVGDTLATDIAGANAAGIRSVRVMTGNRDVGEGASVPTPTLTLGSIAELGAHLGIAAGHSTEA